MSIELMKQALEALGMVEPPQYALNQVIDAVNALSAAIAEQEKAQPEYWQWRRKADLWSVDKIYSTEVLATTEDSEVRKLYTRPASSAPPGYVLVPVEPTEEMCKAGDDCQDSDPEMDDSPSYYAYKAMLAAAPKVQSAPLLSDEEIETLFAECVEEHDSKPEWFARAIERRVREGK